MIQYLADFLTIGGLLTIYIAGAVVASVALKAAQLKWREWRR